MADITFSKLDPSQIESEVIAAYEQIAQTTLYPGDPVRVFLETLAYTLTLQNTIINQAGQQNLLGYATGGHLDEVARLVGTQRLPASRATVTQSFELAQPLDFDVVIPLGTQVASGDGKVLFVTLEECTVKAGELSTRVTAQAAEAGAAANGMVAGQVNVLVTPVAYVAKTANVTPSIYGSDAEDDARLRSRAQLAPESFTCAGPTASYRYLALAAHQDVAEVSIWTPVPGTVDVRPVLANGELPTPEILDLVRQKLSADDVRPLTDTVIVAAPEPIEYDIVLTWALDKTNEAMSATIAARVAAAVEQYRLWQRSKPGRDINPTKLVSLMEQAGARRVDVTSPAFAKLEPRQIARERVMQVTYLGAEDE